MTEFTHNQEDKREYKDHEIYKPEVETDTFTAADWILSTNKAVSRVKAAIQKRDALWASEEIDSVRDESSFLVGELVSKYPALGAEILATSDKQPKDGPYPYDIEHEELLYETRSALDQNAGGGPELNRPPESTELQPPKSDPR